MFTRETGRVEQHRQADGAAEDNSGVEQGEWGAGNKRTGRRAGDRQKYESDQNEGRQNKKNKKAQTRSNIKYFTKGSKNNNNKIHKQVGQKCTNAVEKYFTNRSENNKNYANRRVGVKHKHKQGW